MNMLFLRSKMASMKLILSLFLLLFFVWESETKTKLDYQQRLKLAQDHYKRVAHQITCGVPRPKLFRINPPSMSLLPPATVLHRCGEQAGCCNIPTYKCVAKKKEKVKLHFLVKSFPGAMRRRHKIKKFVLTNHTECHCLDMSYRPR